MSSTKIPSGEMPIVYERLNPSDADDSDTLNLQELQKMSDQDILSTFKYSIDSQQSYYPIDNPVSVDHALDVLQQLKPETRTYILRGLDFDGVRVAYMTGLAKRNLDQLIDDVVRDYSKADAGYFYHDSDGLKGHLLLKGLDDKTKTEIMDCLEERYPEYAALVKSWDRPANPDRYHQGRNFDPDTLPIFGYNFLAPGIFRYALPPTDRTPVKATHENVVDAIREVVQGRDFKVFGFGETHIQTLNTPDATSFEYFASDIVPYLVQEQGVQVIGVEMMWEESNGEIDYYMQHGVIDAENTPRLFARSQGSQEWSGVLTLLETVRQLRAKGFTVDLKGLNTDERDAAAAKVITINSLWVANTALREGKKVALYNGSSHNEITATPDSRHAAYAPALAVSTEQMVEFDLIVPDYFTPSLRQAAAKDNELYWRAPENGVHLQGEGNSYNLVVAKNSGKDLIVNGVSEADPPKTDVNEFILLAELRESIKKQLENGIPFEGDFGKKPVEEDDGDSE